jgi:hypothetical protein
MKNPCATSHKGVFYDNDFSYVCDPDFCGHCIGDALKAHCVGCGTLDIGGQWRLRYHHEHGMKGVRFQNNNDDFLLNRLRLYADWEVNSWLRLYVEGIYADSYGENFPARLIDVNNGDLLNAFVDAKLTGDVTLRVGRQELQYGAQRTISPLDWGNTRRTFEGVKLITKHCDWSIDGFYTNLVRVAPDDFDEADHDISFYGIYSVYSGLQDSTVDIYALGLDNENIGLSIWTLGARINGGNGDWLWEAEGAYQGGDAANAARGAGVDHDAGFFTVGLGRKFECLCWKPTLWVYYDYASGDDGVGDFNGYNQIFPLAHKYLGFIDAVQRSNIEAPNVLLTMQPHDKVKLLLWYYYFQSNSGAPVPSIGGTPPQNASKDLGQELDAVVTYTITPRSSILFGYSHFWRGNKIANGAPATNDADFFYTQWHLNF